MQAHHIDVFAMLDTRIVNKIMDAKQLLYRTFPKDEYFIKIVPALSFIKNPTRASSVGGQVVVVRRQIPLLRFVRCTADPSGCGALTETVLEHSRTKHRFKILSLYAPSRPSSSQLTESQGLWNKLSDYLNRTHNRLESDPLDWLHARLKRVVSDNPNNTIVALGDFNQDPQSGTAPTSFLGSLINAGLLHNWYLRLRQAKCNLVTFPSGDSTIDHVLTNAAVDQI